MMTHRVSEREQGELQGALQSMRSITFIIGPWLFLRIFGWFVDAKNPIHLPGAPYLLAGALLFTAMLMATRVEQPEIRPVAPGPVPDVVPPESIPSAAIAPIVDSQENV
jgi:DHA1 family tetracycline resistance protein-like MFS transporter